MLTRTSSIFAELVVRIEQLTRMYDTKKFRNDFSDSDADTEELSDRLTNALNAS